MIRVRIDKFSAAADPPDGYGLSTVRISQGHGTGENIGTINFDEDKGFWVALQPKIDGFSEGTYEPSATAAARWLLQAFIRERARG